MAPAPPEPATDTEDRDELAPLANLAATISRLRLRRARELPALNAMFSDPAWDVLLDLFVAHARSRRVSVSSLCIAANASTTTSLRWIMRLEGVGAIRRVPDPIDGRRSFVELDPEIFEQMRTWLSSGRDQLGL